MSKIRHIFSKEHRRRISESMKGKPSGMLGKHHLEETKRKISTSHIGLHHSKETKRKMSLSHKGKFHPHIPGAIYHTKKGDRKISEAHRGVTKNDNSNLAHSKESKRKISIAQKRIWQNLEYRGQRQKAMRLGCVLKPTKPEKNLNKELNKLFPNEYKYVGNGTFWIGHNNPDFININGQKKIIELFGDYWHSKKVTGIKKKEHRKQRQKHFAKYGYKTCVVWEHELKNIKQVNKKLVTFHNEIS